MEEGASPPRWALDKKLGEDASMEEEKEGEKERGGGVQFPYSGIFLLLILRKGCLNLKFNFDI